MVEEKNKAYVYTPKNPRLRKGRGFSIEELRKADLSLYQAKRFGISVDKRRRSEYAINVQRLKEDFGKVIPINQIKGVGEVAEKKLADVGVFDVQDLSNVNIDELSKKISYSKKTLKKWQEEAKKLLK